MLSLSTKQTRVACVSLHICVEAEDSPLPKAPLWHEHHFELKAIYTQQIQKKKKALYLPHPHPQLSLCARHGAINRDSSLPKKLI